MAITKDESYRRSGGKERAAMDVAHRFFAEVVGVAGETVTEKWENILRGDIRFPSGQYAECKGQPVDPYRYSHNFVEVCEATANPDLVGGMGSLASLLRIPLEDLTMVPVRNHDGTTSPFGYHRLLHNSLQSISHSRVTLYVNSAAGHVYAYGRNEILRAVSSAVSSRGMLRGAGNSHEDTFGALTALPSMRWELDGGSWNYFGPSDGRSAAARIASVLDEPQD